MIEIDGPQMAWFEDNLGNKYIYVVYALAANNPAQCVQAYANWRKEYEEEGKILVWRMRPTLSQHDKDAGIWKMVCRCVKMPVAPPGLFLPVKEEGCEVPQLLS